MRKCFSVVFPITFFVVTLSVWAGDFWEKKKFVDWSDKEVTKMLTKSPWARSVTVSVGSLLDSHGQGDGYAPSGSNGSDSVIRTKRPLGGQVMTAEGRLRKDAKDADGRRAAGAPGVSQGGEYGASRPSGRFRPRVTLTVRWYSALPLKQAVVKTRSGSQIDPSRQAAESLKKEETHYVIGISGVPFPMVVRHSELADSDSQELPPIRQRLQEIIDRTKSESFLKIKGRRPIAAEAVRVKREVARNAVNAKALRSGADIYFVFPRLGDGTEMITLQDKKVEFVTQIGPLKVERKFKLKDMVYNGKLEL